MSDLCEKERSAIAWSELGREGSSSQVAQGEKRAVHKAYQFLEVTKQSVYSVLYYAQQNYDLNQKLPFPILPLAAVVVSCDLRFYSSSAMK